MSETTETKKKVLSLGGKGKLSARSGGDAGEQVRQSFSHGRSKAVQVEVKRARRGDTAAKKTAETAPKSKAEGKSAEAPPRKLTKAEQEARLRALKGASQDGEEEVKKATPASPVLRRLREQQAKAEAAEAEARAAEEAAKAEEEAKKAAPDDAVSLREREAEELRRIREQDRAAKEQAEQERQAAEDKRKADEAQARQEMADRAGRQAAAKIAAIEDRAGGRPGVAAAPVEDDDGPRGKKRSKPARTPTRARSGEERRRAGRLTVTQALSDDVGEMRTRSLASVRRQREKSRQEARTEDAPKITRDVVVPETITVQELANRMAERGADVIKALMKMGMMVTLTQSIDQDTAELLVEEFGHRTKRVSDSDIELGIEGADDDEGDLLPRPPVVTIMGHVDHGKTSLLDALRETDVAAGEAGGITQHIGAYQVTLASGAKITFIDTPGHAAFTEMRSRGANITDIAVIVVAADDSVMPQTIEAISHAKAAGVPIIIAINKMDAPGADAMKVKQELLQHDIIVEEMSGDVLSVEVSAKTKEGLDRLEEAILLQAELMEIRANPNRGAIAAVIEAKVETGRGSVATVLVQKGTLKRGDSFVTGSEWGRVRALVTDRGEQVESAGPGMPIEVLGLNGTPMAGDDFIVVDDEARAREIADYRGRKKRDAAMVTTKSEGAGSLEELLSAREAEERLSLGVVVKGDVHGSVEAIAGSLLKITEEVDEIDVKILHTGVGPISEADVTLAKASGGLIIAFNVRANAQARELAKRDTVEIRYYSVIYDVVDDVKAAVSGMLSPVIRQEFIGYAEIREIFNITKVGKVAGCYVTEGIVKRGAGVRLLRDNVVIHEGTLKTLKRFKDEVKEVREGLECGMAFENYDDIKVGDVIEAFERIEEARTL